MSLFNQYEYIKSLQETDPELGPEEDPILIPEIEALHRVSGLRNLEETLENIRDLKDYMLLIEDDDDGYLNLQDKNVDTGFRTLYIVGRTKLNNSTSRTQVQAQCKLFALKLFNQFLADSHNFGDLTYGFDPSRIDYRRIGPLVENYHGFAFSYVITNENFNLVQ